MTSAATEERARGNGSGSSAAFVPDATASQATDHSSVFDAAVTQVVVWYLLDVTQSMRSRIDKTLAHGETHRSFSAEPVKFFDEKTSLASRLRRLVARTLVRSGGCLQRGHGLKAFSTFILNFWRKPDQIVSEVSRVATQEYLLHRAEAFLLQVHMDDLLRAEASGDFQALLQSFEIKEHEAAHRFLGEHAHALVFIRSTIVHDYKDLVTRTLWVRYGPVSLMLLATAAAFLVSGWIWRSAAEDLSLIDLARAWWRFLAG